MFPDRVRGHNGSELDGAEAALAMKWMTPKQVAEKLLVTEQTVRSWLREGTLAGAKFGDVWRISTRDFERFIRLSMKRGRRYEPSPELVAMVKEKGFEILDSFGGGDEVDLYLDVDPELDELILTSTKRWPNFSDEATADAHPTAASFYTGTACIAEADNNPYGELMVRGDSHSETLTQLVAQIAQLRSMFVK